MAGDPSPRASASGHRNWIAVVDSAYPLQISPGVETIETGEDMPEVLGTVLKMLGGYHHVKPVAYMDSELASVPASFVPGIDARRAALEALVAPFPRQTLLHAALLAKLNEDGASYKVVVLKTTSLIPYSSVFLRLECGYWSDAAEADLRQRMQTK
jgi:hypothetical protein